MNHPGNFAGRMLRAGVLLPVVGFALFSTTSLAGSFSWFSDPNRINLTSTGQLMHGGVRFELGVFTDGFVPSSSNTSQWAAHWVAADRTTYNAVSKRISSGLTVFDNEAPFTVGANGYVWGFSGGETAGEWILFRNTAWNWPSPNLFSPINIEWSAAQANVVILGSIHPSGSPSLMQTAAVSNSLPPTTSWAQWQTEELSGISQSGPSEDADGDGSSNLIEYVFGTAPTTPNPPVSTPPSVLELNGSRYLQISIPRRRDHPAELVVEVSSDLLTWQSGASHTQVVGDTASALVVRDLTPLGQGASKRFMRLRVLPPSP